MDVFKVEAFLDELAQECKRRMEQNGVDNDLDGLKVLNQVMFALPEDGRCAYTPGRLLQGQCSLILHMNAADCCGVTGCCTDLHLFLSRIMRSTNGVSPL